MHEPHAAVQVSFTVPGLEARAQRRQFFCINTEAGCTELHQVRHDLRGLIHLIVHHHALQVFRADLAGLGQRTQALQRKTRTHSQWLAVLTDQR
ncbi:hypothetical protein D3C76_1619700 [compost metagenome]